MKAGKLPSPATQKAQEGMAAYQLNSISQMENIKTMEDQNSFAQEQLLDMWTKIGKANYWIREADDPPFDKTMLVNCSSLDDLQTNFEKGNWCLGQGFYYQNLCFINQINGGDEWLTIKDDYAFESITFERIIMHGEFSELVNRLLKATKEQCKNLDY